MNLVYLRLLIYVLSTLAGMIPAGWAGLVSYDATAGVLVISLEGMAAAVAVGLGGSVAILRRWGKF